MKWQLTLVPLTMPSPLTTDTDKVRLHFTRYKHGKRPASTRYKHGKRPASTIIEPQANKWYCPVPAWHDYSTHRGSAPGLMFLTAAQQPVSRQDFAAQLTPSLRAYKVGPQLYKSHSFRISAATYAAECNQCVLQIQEGSVELCRLPQVHTVLTGLVLHLPAFAGTVPCCTSHLWREWLPLHAQSGKVQQGLHICIKLYIRSRR